MSPYSVNFFSIQNKKMMVGELAALTFQFLLSDSVLISEFGSFCVCLSKAGAFIDIEK
jgi:hypothetical protein